MTDRPQSVQGTDQGALAALLSVHAAPSPRVLDCTYSRGSMWRGFKADPALGHQVCADLADIEGLDVRADFTALPFIPLSFDVIVFDPPHIADGGANGMMTRRYGTAGAGRAMRDWFGPFLTEACRVLQPGGVVLAKIADGIHGGTYQWEHVAFLEAVRDVGMEAVDCVIRVRTNTVNDPKWRRVLHMRRAHVYWIAARKL